MLYPGMTDREIFYVPFSIEHVASALVTYSQNGIVLIEKSADEFAPEGDQSSFEVHLSQEDTLRLSNNCKTVIQINVMTNDGERYTSDPILLTTGIQSHRAVMT